MKKSNVFWIFEQHVVGDGPEDVARLLERRAVDRNPLLQLLRRLVRQVQVLLQRFGVGVAADRDVAGEHRLVAVEDVDVDGAGAGVEQHDDLAGLEAVVGLVGVLQRERIDVDDDGVAARLRDHAGVVADLVFLRGDEQHFHAAARLGAGAGIEDLIVEIHVLDVERDVLLRLPVDRLVQLRLRSSPAA